MTAVLVAQLAELQVSSPNAVGLNLSLGGFALFGKKIFLFWL